MNENEVLVGGFLQAEEVVYCCDGKPQLKFKLEIEASQKRDIPSYGIDCFYDLDTTREWKTLKLGAAGRTYLIVKGKLGKCTFPDETDCAKKGAIIIVKSVQIFRGPTTLMPLIAACPARDFTNLIKSEISEQKEET